jgi:hypothetical protein
VVVGNRILILSLKMFINDLYYKLNILDHYTSTSTPAHHLAVAHVDFPDVRYLARPLRLLWLHHRPREEALLADLAARVFSLCEHFLEYVEVFPGIHIVGVPGDRKVIGPKSTEF